MHPLRLVASSSTKVCSRRAEARGPEAPRPPILLVWGAEDKAVPPHIGEQAKALLGDVPLVLVPDAGHAPYMENPDAFDRPVLDFLTSASAR